jgi:uncharacterized membrane protein
MIKIILGAILFIVGIVWLGIALYLAWPPLLNIYAAYLLLSISNVLLGRNNDL